MIVEPARFIERLSEFLQALPPLESDTCYAVVLTPRFIRALREANVRYCIGVHARMPDVRRQARALAMLDEDGLGPLIVRWSLHSGFRYEQAKAKYEPFDKIVDADLDTREALAELAARYAIAGQPVVIAANNKAEGSRRSRVSSSHAASRRNASARDASRDQRRIMPSTDARTSCGTSRPSDRRPPRNSPDSDAGRSSSDDTPRRDSSRCRAARPA